MYTWTLKRKCRHFDDIFDNGCTESCHNDSFWCNQERKGRQNDDVSVSVLNGTVLTTVTTDPFLLQWHHIERDDASNHRRHDCLLRGPSKKTSKLRVAGPCEGNPPVTGGFPSQRTSDVENVSFDDVIMPVQCVHSPFTCIVKTCHNAYQIHS